MKKRVRHAQEQSCGEHLTVEFDCPEHLSAHIGAMESVVGVMEDTKTMSSGGQ